MAVLNLRANARTTLSKSPIPMQPLESSIVLADVCSPMCGLRVDDFAGSPKWGRTVAPAKQITPNVPLAVSSTRRDISLRHREGIRMSSPTPVRQKIRRILCSSAASLVLCSSIGHADDGDRGNHRGDTRTPIKHVVVIIPENRTFDNYFGILSARGERSRRAELAWSACAEIRGAPRHAGSQWPDASLAAEQSESEHARRPGKPHAAWPRRRLHLRYGP